MVVGPTRLLVAAVPLWERLTPLDRARLGMALLAFVLLFIGVIAFIAVAGRMARREIRKPLPPVRDLTDAWARKPLETLDQDAEPEPSESDETGPV